MEEIRFDGRTLLVTGGGRGLGRAQAILLGSRGANVVVADNGSAMDGERPDAGPAETVAAEIRSSGGTAATCTADLSMPEGANTAVAACLENFGRIDGLIHYASTSPELTSPDKLPERELELVMQINPLAAIRMARAAWPYMASQGFGRLVFTPSAAIYGALGNLHYATAKSAYLGLVRTLALEGADLGIRTNAVMPGARTRMTERFHPSAYAEWFFRVMAPEKVATAAAFLLSEECTINGEAFALGGGRIARVTIAEAEGETDMCGSIEQVRDAMPEVMADTRFMYPADLSERSAKVAGLMGFDGGLEASTGYAVKSLSED